MDRDEFLEIIFGEIQERLAEHPLIPRVIAVTAPNYEADKALAVDHAKSLGWEIMEVRESEFVRPGDIKWLCYECESEL